MNKEEDKLDNPVWHSLNELHHKYSLTSKDTRFYKPEYCPFGGFTSMENITAHIDNYAKLTDNFYVVGDKPHFSQDINLKKELVCFQMILHKPIELKIMESIRELKTEKQKNDLFQLVNLVQPGYFNRMTSDLGTYWGIYKNENLIAVTGERMKMHRYTEVSAVVTHPEHTRKGYSKQLISHATSFIFRENKTPYLHVTESNTGAINLYEKLGFITRRKISFWNFIKS